MISRGYPSGTLELLFNLETAAKFVDRQICDNELLAKSELWWTLALAARDTLRDLYLLIADQKVEPPMS